MYPQNFLHLTQGPPTTVIIEAVLEGEPTETELFTESVEEYYVSCPGFIVSSSLEGLRNQHPSLHSSFNIDILRILPEGMKFADLTENMHFSYSSARDTYSVNDLYSEPSPMKTNLHSWHKFAETYAVHWQKAGAQQQNQTKTFLGVNRDAGIGGEISWTFRSEGCIKVNNLLVYVNSDDDVKWQLQIWTSENELDPIELTPKQEKFDKLNENVTKMKLTADLPSTKARIFEENLLRNQVSMLVAINKATDVYLNNKGQINDDIPAPSAQNKNKAFVLLPDENDIFVYKHMNNKDSNQAMIN